MLYTNPLSVIAPLPFEVTFPFKVTSLHAKPVTAEVVAVGKDNDEGKALVVVELE